MKENNDIEKRMEAYKIMLSKNDEIYKKYRIGESGLTPLYDNPPKKKNPDVEKALEERKKKKGGNKNSLISIVIFLLLTFSITTAIFANPIERQLTPTPYTLVDTITKDVALVEEYVIEVNGIEYPVKEYTHYYVVYQPEYCDRDSIIADILERNAKLSDEIFYSKLINWALTIAILLSMGIFTYIASRIIKSK